MPSSKLFGLRWHTTTDALPILGAVLAVFNAVLLAVFIVFLLMFSRPVGCSNHETRVMRARVAVWGTLAFIILSFVLAVLMVLFGLLGTPFEPSKRWPMQFVLYAQSAKWVMLLGWLPFSIFAVYSSPAHCWASERRTETIALLWSTVGIVCVIYLTALCTYNLLAKQDADDRWQKRLVVLSKLLGCYKVLQGAEMEDMGGDVAAPLQEIAGSFARFFGQIDVEKTDVLAGFILAEVMQVQQRRTRIAEALQRRGVGGRKRGSIERIVSQGARLGQEEQDGDGEGNHSSFEQIAGYVEEHCRLKEQQKRQHQGGDRELSEEHQGGFAGRSGSHGAGDDRPRPPGESQSRQAGPGAAEGSEGPAQQAQQQQQGRGHQPEPDDQSGHVRLDVDGPLLKWMRDISQGRNFCLTPSRYGAKLAPHLTPQQTAEMYTGSTDYVDEEVLREAHHWSRYAIAAYGHGGFTWTTARTFGYWLDPSYWRAKAQLASAVHPVRRVIAQAKPPVQQKLRESKAYVRHYVGACKIAGASHDDFVYTSFTNEALGATPYIILLDRPSKTVVLAIRGSNSYEDLITDLIDRPVDIRDWVPQDLKEEENIEGRITAHAGMFAAAKAVLTDLNKHQILPILLCGEPLSKAEQERQRAVHAADSRDESAWRRSRDSRRGAQTQSQRPPAQVRGSTLIPQRGSREKGDKAGRGDATVHGTGDPYPTVPETPPGSSPRWLGGQPTAAGAADVEVLENCHGEQGSQPGCLPRLSQPLRSGSFQGKLPSLPVATRSWVGRLSQPFLRLRPNEEPTPARFANWAEAMRAANEGGSGDSSGSSADIDSARLPAGTAPNGYAIHQGSTAMATSGGGSTTAGDSSPGSSPRGQPGVPAERADAASAGATASPADTAGHGSTASSDRAAPSGTPVESKAEHVAEGAAKGGPDMEDSLSVEDFQRLLQERGLDCKGWNLVITGHSLGAAVAALVGMHFRSWCPGVKVWSFNPPGGMTTKNLSVALRGFVTALVVGKDIISRTGTVTFERLLDQMVVALARTRLSKMRVLLQAKAKALRRLPPEAVFRPVEEIPTEALEYVRGYFESKCKFKDLFVPMYPPGRTLQLRRLRDVKDRESWDAVWIEAEQVMEEGILLSRHQTNDHSTARLREVMAQLAAGKGAKGASAGATHSGAAGRAKGKGQANQGGEEQGQ